MSISLTLFLFGLPRHFHFLLCNCLVLSLFVFCGKSNKVTKLKLQSTDPGLQLGDAAPLIGLSLTESITWKLRIFNFQWTKT